MLVGTSYHPAPEIALNRIFQKNNEFLKKL